MKMSKFQSLPHRKGILVTGLIVVIGVVNACVSAVLWGSFLATSLAVVGVCLIGVGVVVLTMLLSGWVTYMDGLDFSEFSDIEHMKRLTASLKELGAEDQKSAVKLESIRKYWYDKIRMNSLVEKGHVARTKDGKLYLIKEVEA